MSAQKVSSGYSLKFIYTKLQAFAVSIYLLRSILGISRYFNYSVVYFIFVFELSAHLHLMYFTMFDQFSLSSTKEVSWTDCVRLLPHTHWFYTYHVGHWAIAKFLFLCLALYWIAIGLVLIKKGQLKKKIIRTFVGKCKCLNPFKWIAAAVVYIL